MIVLDTNVVSALMRSEPDPAVVTWLDSQPPESIWKTSITIFEVRSVWVWRSSRQSGADANSKTPFRDVQIARIVGVHKAILATRNNRHFEGCGLVLVEPWSV